MPAMGAASFKGVQMSGTLGSSIRKGVLLTALAGFGCSQSPTAPSVAGASSRTGEGSASAVTSSPARFNGRGAAGVVYVTSQGLYFDTFATKDPLPFHGRFQLLANGQTEFGPGDPGYLGGRWWVDTDGNGQQDATDDYFLCPLLPPGRTAP
jgi:hypothetical protein